MPSKKPNKSNKKSQHHNKKYVEKQHCHEWTCQICDSLNSVNNVYCQNCLQTLYYYNYVNAHLFVEKDVSYFHCYEPVQSKRKSSWATNDTEGEEDFDDLEDDKSHEKTEEPSLKWVDSLLEG